MKISAICQAILLALSLAAASSAFPQTRVVAPGSDINGDQVRRGWHFYHDPAKDKETKDEEVAPEPEPIKPQPREDKPIVVITGTGKHVPEEAKCGTKDGWTARCGFVDPGEDFEFQAKQRDILLQQMSLRPDDHEAVEAAQYYMKWVVGKASQAANMWYYNMVQNPDLDPTVKNPISEIGISLAAKIKDATQLEFFKLMRDEGGKLFFFSKTDCAFCHDQAPYAKRVARTMGLELINVPLDGKCLPGFEDEACADNVKPEHTAVLQLKVVPALFLYAPENTWIRLGTGVVTDATVIANAVNFFSAYRAAMLNGLTQGDSAKPAVTFDPALNQKTSGVASAETNLPPPQGPSQAKLMDLMGYKKK